MTRDPGEKCLGLIQQGAAQMQAGDLANAELLFRTAAQEVRPLPPGPAFDYALLVQCHVSLLRQRLGQLEEAKKLRETAMGDAR